MGQFDMRALIKGFLLALLAGLIGILAITGILYFTGVSEDILPLAGKIIIMAAVLAGSIFSAKSCGSKGLFYGLAIALMVMAFLMLGNSLFFTATFELSSSLLKMALLLLAGIIGGMIGIGFS